MSLWYVADFMTYISERDLFAAIDQFRNDECQIEIDNAIAGHVIWVTQNFGFPNEYLAVFSRGENID